MNQIDLKNGYFIRFLTSQNYNDVDALCQDCADFFLMHEGILPSPKLINEIFSVISPEKCQEDKFVLGIYSNAGLIGIVDILKDYPIPAEWMIGLFMVKPNERCKGLGKVIHEALIVWAKELGAKSFRVAVIEENIKGYRFWSALGYERIEEIQMELTAKTHQVDIMRCWV